MQQDYISTTEAAEMLGLSRTQVFRMARSGKIPAIRIGRNFAIKKTDLGIYSGELTPAQKKDIDQGVDKIYKEYEDALKKLGDS